MIQEKTIKMVLGARLTGIMKARGADALDVAIDVGVSDVAVKNWMKGKTLPTMNYITSMCKALNVTIGYLIGTNNYPIDYNCTPYETREIGKRFCDNIEKKLKENNWTHTYFAEFKLYIAACGFRIMLRDKLLPKTTRVVEISEALDVDLNYLCGYSSRPISIKGSDLWRAEYGVEK